MDEFKPEDELKPDPSDRRPGRSRKSDDFDNEPQLNVDDVDLDADEPRSSRSRRPRDDEEEYETDEGLKVDAAERRPARGRKKAPKQKVPVSRQHLMMGIGILVLLLLIIGIGSALKSPSSDTETANKNPNAEKNIDLSGADDSAANQANGAQPQPGEAGVANQTANAGQQQEVNLPSISSTPTDAQAQPTPEGQQRVEVPGDLNNALTQQQGQIDSAVSSSTLPTQPATVARMAGGSNASAPAQSASNSEPARQPAARPERKKVVIEPHKTQPAQTRPQATAKTTVAEPKPVTTAKRSEPVVAAPVKEPVKAPAATVTPAPKATTPAATASTAAPVASGNTVTGDASAIKGAPGSHYTLQLSSSSNSANLNAWAKKENLQHYMVYQTVRNGQPWYVLISGVYASKDEAKRAVSTLPADVQAKNPWAKPIHQVQSDLK
jgi:DamX protein